MSTAIDRKETKSAIAHRALTLFRLLAIVAVSARVEAQACYSVDIITSARTGGGCVDFACTTDGCTTVTGAGLWTCQCLSPPGAVNIVGWAMGIGMVPVSAAVQGASGLQGILPDIVLDLTPTNGYFTTVLPPPPALSGATVFVQLAAYAYGSGACLAPFLWHLSDSFQVSFT